MGPLKVCVVHGVGSEECGLHCLTVMSSCGVIRGDLALFDDRIKRLGVDGGGVNGNTREGSAGQGHCCTNSGAQAFDRLEPKSLFISRLYNYTTEVLYLTLIIIYTVYY